MSRQTLAIAVGAIVLFAVAVIGAMAFTGGGDNTPVMTMPDGSTMPAGEMTTEGTHTMDDGSTMSDEEMSP